MLRNGKCNLTILDINVLGERNRVSAPRRFLGALTRPRPPFRRDKNREMAAMRIMKVGRSMAGWALTLGLGIALTPSAARTEELTKFTGYTRPGIPNGPAGAIKDAAGQFPDGV